jgi:hypothetical protein
MYINRFNKEALRINVFNSCTSLELASPVHCSNGTVCCISPSQQTDLDTTMEASFGIVSVREDFKGALLYKLRRKYVIKNDYQSDSSTASIENTTTDIYLLVALGIEDGWDDFHVCLVECTNDFTWDEGKLWALHSQYKDQFHRNYYYNVVTWLMRDDAVIKIRHKVTYGSEYKLDIFISEGIGECTMNKPMKIDPERLVLLSSMLIMLIYTARLSIQPSVKLNIHNRCLNVDLVSPTYITGNGLECCRSPGYRVYAENIMKSAFIIDESDDMPYGVLIYRLQRMQSHESDEADKDTSSATHLLVVWRISKSKKLYTYVTLVEHAKAFIWNRDKLNKLYHEGYDRLKERTDITSDTWLVDNNMTLKMTFCARDLEGNPELSISISEEEKGDYIMRPLLIDPER